MFIEAKVEHDEKGLAKLVKLFISKVTRPIDKARVAILNSGESQEIKVEIRDEQEEEGDDVVMTEHSKDVSQGDELFEGDTQERSWDNLAYLSGVNAKRTYDAYQDVDLARARADLAHSERMNVLAENSIVQLQTHQADLNAQKIRVIEIATENQWEGANEVSGEAVVAALAAAVAKELNKDE